MNATSCALLTKLLHLAHYAMNATSYALLTNTWQFKLPKKGTRSCKGAHTRRAHNTHAHTHTRLHTHLHTHMHMHTHILTMRGLRWLPAPGGAACDEAAPKRAGSSGPAPERNQKECARNIVRTARRCPDKVFFLVR